MMESENHTTVDQLCPTHLSLIENDGVALASSRERNLQVNGVVDADGFVRFKKRNVSARRTFPRGCGRILQSVRSENICTSLAQSVNEIEPVPKCSTRLSAKRKFPFGCGRNAQELTAEEREKFLSSRINGFNAVKHTHLANSVTKVSDPGEINSKKPKTEKERILPQKSPTEQRKFVPPVIKVTKNSDELTKGKILNSMQSNDSENANSQEDHEHATLSCGLEFFSGKVIVQALMAAPNCPWMQGKRTPNSFSKGKLKAKKGTESASKSKSPFVGKGKTSPNAEDLTDEQSSLSDKIEHAASYNNNTAVSKGKLKARKKRTESAPISKSLIAVKDNPSPNADALPDEQLVKVEDAAFYENTIYPTGEDDEVLEYVEPISVKPHKSANLSLNLIPFGSSSSSNADQVGARKKVRETLRLFQAIVRKLLQEEERKPKGHMQSGKRVDLMACKLLKEKNRWVNIGKPIMGNVPGVEVGDEFHYRVELCMIGLHRAIQGGIDYLKQGDTILATSIVASGGYDDDCDSTDALIYSGQGGGLVGDKKHPEDQKLERGNLAMKNAIDAKTPVRVIRGFKEMKILDTQESSRSKVNVTYTYDGFYQVEEYWKEKASHGYSVFKFRLLRLPGQPELPWKIVKQVKKSNKNIMRKGLCVGDISDGKEKIPIGVVNTLDNDHPEPFTYIVKMMYPDWHQQVPPQGCDCTNGCSNSKKCACAVRNGGEIPFNHSGAIVEAKPLIYECGPSCKCSITCHNRVSQHGIRFPLEVFKTESRGWGVRSLTSIPSGSFICEYVGELLRDTEADERTGNDEYLFDIGHNYNDESLWEGLSNCIPDLQRGACEEVENVGYTIDALTYGNVGRFINHSCSPNLYAQNVLYDHDDKTLPHIMLFAAENIPPLQELTYHYNYTLDQVRDSEGNIKRKDCYCGSHECTGRLY